MKRSGPTLIASFLLGVLLGFALSLTVKAGAVAKCERALCADNEFCVNEDEWAKTAIGEVDDAAAIEELLKMLEECDRDRCQIQLAEYRGALTECRRAKGGQ